MPVSASIPHIGYFRQARCSGKIFGTGVYSIRAGKPLNPFHTDFLLSGDIFKPVIFRGEMDADSPVGPLRCFCDADMANAFRVFFVRMFDLPFLPGGIIIILPVDEITISASCSMVPESLKSGKAAGNGPAALQRRGLTGKRDYRYL